jgi:Uma2 family endonuclease
VTFVRRDRLPPADRAHRFYEGAPDLAVEIVSPGERAGEIARKVAGYLAAGTSLVWVVYPERRAVVAHHPDGTTRVHGEDATLEGHDVLPSFAAPITEVFAE